MTVDLESVYTGTDLTGLKDYFEEVEYEGKQDASCMDSQSIDLYDLHDLLRGCGDRTEQEVFGLEPYKTLATSYEFGFELFEADVEETKKVLEAR